MVLEGLPERKASVTIWLSIRPKQVTEQATFASPHDAFSFLKTFQNAPSLGY